MKGNKDDNEKIMMDLIPFDCLEEVGKVLTFGAKKYSPNNWQLVDNAASRYEAALLRHFSAYKRGEVSDIETGLPHLSAVVTNALFLLWFQLHSEVNNAV